LFSETVATLGCRLHIVSGVPRRRSSAADKVAYSTYHTESITHITMREFTAFLPFLMVASHLTVVCPFAGPSLIAAKVPSSRLSMIQPVPSNSESRISDKVVLSDHASDAKNKPHRLRKIIQRKSNKTNNQQSTRIPENSNQNYKKAEQVEKQLLLSLGSLQEAASGTSALFTKYSSSKTPSEIDTSSNSNSISGLLFPSIRECNAALATFGDSDELLRALRVFMKMRKAAVLAHTLQASSGWSWLVPTPTLVTYSTIMSRANKCGKPRVALRMWKLMQQQQQFIAGNANNARIVPDIKAANILMNSFAKLKNVDTARDLLQQMKGCDSKDGSSYLWGDTDDENEHTKVVLEPNLITYNTLLDACHKAEDLDAALEVMQELKTTAGLTPDAWSYTSLIAAVARKASTASGMNDPSLAFEFLEEMVALNVQPNGMTYSALIDVCGRCKRCDLALQGLRMMLRQKAADQEYLRQSRDQEQQQHPKKISYKGKPENYILPNEVGAWTAAINALGKEGRLRNAMRLFDAMPNFGVLPNTVTCGCLTDSLVKHGRTADALKVLRYMEDKGIAPSEVMYTSLMSSAGHLAELENKNEYLAEFISREGNKPLLRDEESNAESYNVSGPPCSAIEVYTVLMKSLMEDQEQQQAKDSDMAPRSNKETQEANAHSLIKIFLVFQEMKNSGVQPDLACYNALLRACARAGDISRAQSVLQQLQEDHLEPNDSSWRQLIRAAGKANRTDVVISTWRQAMSYSYDIKSVLGGSFNSQLRSTQWTPSTSTFSAMIKTLLQRAADPNLQQFEKRRIYHKIVIMYVRVMSGNKDGQLGMHRIDAGELLQDSRAMLLILQAIVSLDWLTPTDGTVPNAVEEKSKLHFLAARILALEAFQDITTAQRLSRSNYRALNIAQGWVDDGLASKMFRP